jgi:CTP synthase
MVEFTSHPWFIGCQFHPELQSRPSRPHPLFASFIGAAVLEKKRVSTLGTPRTLASAGD